MKELDARDDAPKLDVRKHRASYPRDGRERKVLIFLGIWSIIGLGVAVPIVMVFG
jgi:hypothetical protein